MIDEATTHESRVEITGLYKRFKRRSGADDVVPIDHVDLTIERGEFIVLLGPSGCGKTTLLRCIAGLERPDKGKIRIAGQDVFDASRRLFLPPNRRPISMIFQSYALWPHMTVFQNVAYPIRTRGHVTKGHAAEAVHRALTQVGLRNLHNEYPGQLSGGQQQRVALARALVADAKLLLFDEPLSNVDAKVRDELRAQLVEMQAELGFTAVHVTHDQQEAMELADRVAVLNSGRIEQLATPREVYSRPATQYVAKFVGIANLYHGRVAARDGNRLQIDASIGRVIAEDERSTAAVGDEVDIMFRPEDVVLGHETELNSWQVSVIRSSFSGAQQSVQLTIGDERLAAVVDKHDSFPDSTATTVTVAPGDVRVLDALNDTEVAA